MESPHKSPPLEDEECIKSHSLASDLKAVGLRPTSRVVYFRAGANYLRGNHVSILSRETAVTAPVL